MSNDLLNNDDIKQIPYLDRAAEEQIWVVAYGAAFGTGENVVTAVLRANRAVEVLKKLPPWKQPLAERRADQDVAAHYGLGTNNERG